MMSVELSIPPFSQDEMRIIQQKDGLDVEKFNHYTRLFSNWISTQKQLPQQLSADVVCIRKFLIWSNLEFEAAKKKFLKFCYNPVTHPEFISNRSVTEDGDLKILQHCYMFRFLKLTPEGYLVVYVDVKDCDKIDFLSIYRHAALSNDHCVYNGEMADGLVVCLNLKSYKTHHYAKIFNALLWKFLMFLERNYPIKPKHTLIMNCHPVIGKGVQISKTFLSDKIANRIAIISSYEDLQKYLPLEFIPSDYGGKAKSMSQLTDDWSKELMAHAELLERVSRIKPTGPIPAELKVCEHDFGANGSFRQLNID